MTDDDWQLLNSLSLFSLTLGRKEASSPGRALERALFIPTTSSCFTSTIEPPNWPARPTGCSKDDFRTLKALVGHVRANAFQTWETTPLDSPGDSHVAPDSENR